MPVRRHGRPDLSGYSGGVTIAELFRSCASIPDAPGVYLVVAPAGFQARFLGASTGGRIKDRDPTVPVPALRDSWLPLSAVLYIGKATRLRARIRQYIRFGQGHRSPHWGGRHIWQLARARDLLFYWKVARDPALAERDLLARFRAQHGRLPFANLRM